jgi:hypothetical protein
MLREPRRLGTVRSEMFGYAVITVLLLVGAIYTLKLFTAPERADLNPSAPVASVPVPKATEPAVPVPPVVPDAPPTRKYAQTLADDRKALPGPWLRHRNSEAKGGPQPGLRLRFDEPAAQLTCERPDPNDPPLARTAYRYEVMEQDGVRYLKLTDPAAPDAEPLYVPYQLDKTALQLDGARPGRMEQGKLLLSEPAGTDLQGTWLREPPP